MAAPPVQRISATHRADVGSAAAEPRLMICDCVLFQRHQVRHQVADFLRAQLGVGLRHDAGLEALGHHDIRADDRFLQELFGGLGCALVVGAS